MRKRNAIDSNIQNESPNKKRKSVESDAQLDSSIATLPDDFVLNKELVEGTLLTDLSQNEWRVGKPIGKSYEFFLYCYVL